MAPADTTAIHNAVTGNQEPTNPPLNGGDSLTIAPPGSIQNTDYNKNGASTTSASNNTNNAGISSTSGDESKGIHAASGGSTIINPGTIGTQESSSRGVHATDGLNAIINTGQAEHSIQAALEPTETMTAQPTRQHL